MLYHKRHDWPNIFSSLLFNRSINIWKVMWFSPQNGSKQCAYPVWQVTDQGWLCVSGEKLMENTPASPEGSSKAPEYLCRHGHSWKPQKEQDHKPKHHCVFCFPIPLSIFWSAFSFCLVFSIYLSSTKTQKFNAHQQRYWFFFSLVLCMTCIVIFGYPAYSI